MSQRLRFNTAQDLFDAFPKLSDEIAATPSELPSLDFVRKLEAGATPEEAITVMAYLLPRREAVWWGHQCLTQIPAAMAPADQRFLDLVEDWVREPDENQRVAALEEATEEKSPSPAVWIAFGAGWSGGSMISGDVVVPPAPELTPQAVSIAILAALARVDLDDRAATLRTFVDMGVQLVDVDRPA